MYYLVGRETRRRGEIEADDSPDVLQKDGVEGGIKIKTSMVIVTAEGKAAREKEVIVKKRSRGSKRQALGGPRKPWQASGLNIQVLCSTGDGWMKAEGGDWMTLVT